MVATDGARRGQNKKIRVTDAVVGAVRPGGLQVHLDTLRAGEFCNLRLRQQVQQAETSSLLDKMFGGSFTSLFANFLDSDKVSDRTLDELQALIDEKKKEK